MHRLIPLLLLLLATASPASSSASSLATPAPPLSRGCHNHFRGQAPAADAAMAQQLPPAAGAAPVTGAPQAPPILARRPVVLLVGDSLTERGFDPDGGWAAGIAHALSRRADVACRGLSGWNSRWAVKAARRLARGALGLETVAAGAPVVAAPVAGAGAGAGSCPAEEGAGACAAAGGAAAAFPPPSSSSSSSPPPPRELLFATVWFGANDAALPDRGGKLQHVPVDEYARNLEAIAREAIAAATEANAAAAAAAAASAAAPSAAAPPPPPSPVRLLLLTPPPVGDTARVSHQRQRMAECGDPALAQYEGKPLEEGPLPDRTLEASRLYADAALGVARRLREEFSAAGAAAAAGAATTRDGDGDGLAAAAAAPPRVIVAAIDMHAAFLASVEADGGWGRDMFTDGLHFTPEGAREVGRLVAAAAERCDGGASSAGGGGGGASSDVILGGLGLGPLGELPAHLPLWDRLAAPGWEAALEEFFA
jgi:lysophospholipase L1-like esterase